VTAGYDIAPGSLEAEDALLGALLHGAGVDAVLPALTPEHFSGRHRDVFTAVRSAAQRGPVDPVLVLGELRRSGTLHRVGGAAAVFGYLERCPLPANVAGYAREVREAARRRELLAAGQRLVQASETMPLADLEAFAHNALSRLTDEAASVQGHGSSWAPVDLTDVLEGRYQPPAPTVGARGDGVGLFYPGRGHTVASESEAGKTWFALAAVRCELDAGNSAVYLDFEDDEGGVVGRLLALGATPHDISKRFAYIRPDDSIDAFTNRADLAQVLGDLRPTLAVLDGVTEAMTLHGLQMKDNTDVAAFGRTLPRWIADQGPATVSLDHVTKDPETRGRYALGGVHKLNGLNGAAYVLENRRAFGIGLTGVSTVYVAKDRPAQLRQHAVPSKGMHWFADLQLESLHKTSVSASITAPSPLTAEDFRPTTLMHRVSDVLGKAGKPLAGRDIEDRVKGRAQDVRYAIACLVDEEYVTISAGPHNAKLHTLATPFGEDK